MKNSGSEDNLESLGAHPVTASVRAVALSSTCPLVAHTAHTRGCDTQACCTRHFSRGSLPGLLS